MLAAGNSLALNQDIQEEQVVPAPSRIPDYCMGTGSSSKALMSSNMQRQAVPLSRSEKCIVGTGLERQAALDSGALALAERGGKIIYIDTDKILFSGNGDTLSIPLVMYQRSNKNTCYNSEDAVLISERLVVGPVIDVRWIQKRGGSSYNPETIRVYISQKREIKVGDKVAGRHGNKVNKQRIRGEPEYPGKSRIFDGRTGNPFEQPVIIGKPYILKLIHQVDDKIHGRSSGHYALVTQQPLRGRAKQGGQRVGEMEVWALEGFGVAHILQEMLTYKSDHIRARQKVLGTTIIGGTIPNPEDAPESFRLLVRELRSLALVS
ncbi:UNVERIFIED_CONTAM: DNA-directed RNA polymerase subunit beta [Sesamum radiatum]|uniref:DNA-directed RNA polymerase n=1 Tax=Sesamum radiatum TaxID=300843 RepID=A0AAW2JGR2_SESRA